MFSLIISLAVVISGCQPPPSRSSRANEPAPAPKPAPERPEEAHPSPPRDARLNEVLAALWSSYLGHTYFYYLFKAPDDEISTRDVVDRVFRPGGSPVTSLSALQLMTQDLYDRKQMDPRHFDRVVLLQGDLTARQTDLATHPTQNFSTIAATGFLAMLPLGFAPVRNYLRSLLLRIPLTARPRWMRIWSSQARERGSSWVNYDPVFVITAFFRYFDPFMTLYFFWFDWKEGERGHSIWHTLSRLHSEEQYQQFLNDIRAL